MKKLQCLVAALGMGATAAFAGQGGWLVAAVGQSDIDFSVSDLDDGSFIAASENTGGTSFRLGGGYDVNANFGLEAAYFDAGELVAFDAVSDGSSFLYPAGPISGSIEASGLSFGMNGYIPFQDKFRITARAGILMWDADVTVNMLGVSATGSEDGNDPYLGLGAEVDLSPKVGLGANFVRYDIDGDSLDLLELAVRFRVGQ